MTLSSGAQPPFRRCEEPALSDVEGISLSPGPAREPNRAMQPNPHHEPIPPCYPEPIRHEVAL